MVECPLPVPGVAGSNSDKVFFNFFRFTVTALDFDTIDHWDSNQRPILRNILSALDGNKATSRNAKTLTIPTYNAHNVYSCY